MSILMYKGARPEVQARVMASEVVAKIMEGYFIAPYSAKQGE
jgi:hypothetical protein